MSQSQPRLGDTIEVSKYHRLRGESGTIVAIEDNPHATYNLFHIRFNRAVRGVINSREIWLSHLDFMVTAKAADNYEAPTDLEKPGVHSDDQ